MDFHPVRPTLEGKMDPILMALIVLYVFSSSHSSRLLALASKYLINWRPSVCNTFRGLHLSLK